VLAYSNGVHRELLADILFVYLRDHPTSPHVHDAASTATALLYSTLPQNLSINRLLKEECMIVKEVAVRTGLE
jgi:hypothetical protein